MVLDIMNFKSKIRRKEINTFNRFGRRWTGAKN